MKRGEYLLEEHNTTEAEIEATWGVGCSRMCIHSEIPFSSYPGAISST